MTNEKIVINRIKDYIKGSNRASHVEISRGLEPEISQFINGHNGNITVIFNSINVMRVTKLVRLYNV